MNSYDLSQVEASKNTAVLSQYMTYGSGQILKINSIELKKSHNTNNPKAILHMETKPITDESFTPSGDAKGQVGKVACGVYMNNDLRKKEFLQKMKIVSIALGVENEVNKIKSDSFEDVVAKISDVISGKYAKYTIFASEYPKDNGKVGITLFLPRFNFVESVDADPSTITNFDINNQYHYKKIVQQGETTGSKFGTYNKPSGSSKYGTFHDSGLASPDDPAATDLPF